MTSRKHKCSLIKCGGRYLSKYSHYCDKPVHLHKSFTCDCGQTLKSMIECSDSNEQAQSTQSEEEDVIITPVV